MSGNGRGQEPGFLKKLWHTFKDYVGHTFSLGPEQYDDFSNDLNSWLNNYLTGELDFNRQLEILDKEQAFNSAEAEKNRQFNLDMASTAFQRQAEDLQKAGYNPGLMLGGSGSSVASVNTPGSSGHTANRLSDNLLGIMTSGFTSALSVANNAVNGALRYAENRERLETEEDISRDKIISNENINRRKIESEEKIASASLLNDSEKSKNKNDLTESIESRKNKLEVDKFKFYQLLNAKKAYANKEFVDLTEEEKELLSIIDDYF